MAAYAAIYQWVDSKDMDMTAVERACGGMNYSVPFKTTGTAVPVMAVLARL